MLSRDQERQLEMIGAQITIEDPRFAEGLTAGRPRRPRQYSSWVPAAELVVALLLIIGSAFMDAGMAVLAGASTVVGLAALWSHRRLGRDRAPRL